MKVYVYVKAGDIPVTALIHHEYSLHSNVSTKITVLVDLISCFVNEFDAFQHQHCLCYT